MVATPEQRLDWALEHYLAARDIFHSGRNYGWANTALFYSAMHMVMAGLPTVQGLTIAQQHPESHEGRVLGAEGRNVIVRRHLPEIRTAYSSLYGASIDARYHGGRPTRDVVRQHRANDLGTVALWACAHIHKGEKCDCWLNGVRDRWPILDPDECRAG